MWVMVSGADNFEFQIKLHYLVSYGLEHVTKPFEFIVVINKKCIIIGLY